MSCWTCRHQWRHSANLLGICRKAVPPTEIPSEVVEKGCPEYEAKPAKNQRIRDIENLAQKCGYVLEQEQANIGLLIFIKPGIQVNVYTTKMTVATSLHHPTKGKTQLFCRNTSMQELEKIFLNPRVHLNRRYYTHAG